MTFETDVPHTRPMRLVLIFALIALLPGSALVHAGSEDPRWVTLPGGRKIRAEVARTPEELSRGLMFRSHLPDDHGMLFIFDRSEPHLIWMKNTPIPLDIIWMDDQRKIIHIEIRVPPCRADPCPIYGPSQGSRYVLEVNGGKAAEWGMSVGMPLQF